MMPTTILNVRDDEPRDSPPVWTWGDVAGHDPETRAIAAKDHLATVRQAVPGWRRVIRHYEPGTLSDLAPSRRMRLLVRLPFWILVLFVGWTLVRSVLG